MHLVKSRKEPARLRASAQHDESDPGSARAKGRGSHGSKARRAPPVALIKGNSSSSDGGSSSSGGSSGGGGGGSSGGGGGKSTAHSHLDRASPFPWHRYDKVWSDERCELLGQPAPPGEPALLGPSLSECKASCLDDERCTALNFFEGAGGCELRHCANGEVPSVLRAGWTGFSSYSPPRKPVPLLSPPPRVAKLPGLLAMACIGVALVGVLLVLLLPRRGRWLVGRAGEGAGSVAAAAQRGGGGGAVAKAKVSAVLAEDEEPEDWHDPVLTDPVACHAREGTFLCSGRQPSEPAAGPATPAPVPPNRDRALLGGADDLSVMRDAAARMRDEQSRAEWG